MERITLPKSISENQETRAQTIDGTYLNKPYKIRVEITRTKGNYYDRANLIEGSVTYDGSTASFIIKKGRLETQDLSEYERKIVQRNFSTRL